MKKNHTITIGIPAFNEAANIGYLLDDIQKQICKGFILNKIIINSDGSTDATCKIIKENNRLPIELLANKQRKGVGYRQNEILKRCDSDIIVLLNADIRIKDVYFIKKLVQPILDGNAALTSCPLTNTKPVSFIEKCLSSSNTIKENIFGKYRNGNSVYNCHGTARALSKALYMNIRFTRSIGDDAYTYLFAKSRGFQFVYVRSTEIFFRLPSTMADHINQSQRFFQSINLLKKDFGNEAINSEYAIPLKLQLQITISSLIHDPLHVACYLFILAFMKMKTLHQLSTTDLWQRVATSKQGITI